ncbi:transient receptor potential channel pyrexia-like [Penaeus indicus]|uniref:transient receptor potential channel pyrexia-like n=1 Tax=Penaeus indicus TaxID=29960 RepID=UPI00300CF1EB
MAAAAAAAGGVSEHDRRELVKALRDGEADEASAILERRPNLATTLTPQPLVHLAVTAPANAPRLLGLLLDAGAPAEATNARGLTALHVAALRGISPCVRRLLSAGADVNYQDSDGRIPLFYAARSRRDTARRCLQMLLEAGSSLDVPDTYGATPLHAAVESGNVAAVEALLRAGANHACKDAEGCTPLHSASSSLMAETLLAAGADVTFPDNCNKSSLDKAIRYKSSIAHTMLGAGLAVQGDLQDSDLRVYFHLNLAGGGARGEASLLNTMVTHGQTQLLKHPLCEAFLHLKWLIVSPLFYMKLAIYVCLVTSLTGDVCLRSILPTPGNTSLPQGAKSAGMDTDVVLLLATICQSIAATLLVLVALRGVLLMIILKTLHWRRLEKWVELIFCACSVLLLVMEGPLRPWERHVAVFSLMLGWFQITVLIGHIPAVGIYVQMFQAVSLRMLVFAGIFSSLFVGFAVSFHLLFEARVFEHVTTAHLKTLAMMVGELDFADILGPEAPDALPGTAQVMYVVFVMAMTVVATNLMVGLAVQDIQELQKEAGVRRLALTVEQEEAVDRVLRSALLSSLLPAAVASWLRRRFSLLFHLPPRQLLFHTPGYHVKNLLGSEWSGPANKYNIFICPNDRFNPGQVYCSMKTNMLVPTGYFLPSWVLKNTRNLLETCGFAEHNKENDITEDDQDEYNVKKEPISLEALQEQMSDLQGSVRHITQMLQKISDGI